MSERRQLSDHSEGERGMGMGEGEAEGRQGEEWVRVQVSTKEDYTIYSSNGNNTRNTVLYHKTVGFNWSLEED